MAMPHDHDITYFQHTYGILDGTRRGMKVVVWFKRRYEVADIAKDKKISRLGSRDEIGYHS